MRMDQIVCCIGMSSPFADRTDETRERSIATDREDGVGGDMGDVAVDLLFVQGEKGRRDQSSGDEDGNEVDTEGRPSWNVGIAHGLVEETRY
jgi:hypothetical protein